MINCKKTYLAESKSLGFNLAGVNRGVGTYQALLPWVSEINQFAAIQNLCRAGQTASTKGGEECRRARLLFSGGVLGYPKQTGGK